MSDEQPARDPIGEDARIDALDERLKAAREQEEKRNRAVAGGEADANYRMGNRVLAELIGGIGGGAFLGWVIDDVIDWVSGRKSHVGLVVVMFLGIIVAFRNIIRISNRRPD